MGNTFTQTCLIAADLADVKVEVINKFEGVFKKANGEVVQAPTSLTGKFPTLATDGGNINESSAISAHFARMSPDRGLFGQSVFETAQVEMWISFAQGTLWPAAMPPILAVLGHEPFVAAKDFSDMKKKFTGILRIIDNHLNGKHFLVGDNLTIADVIVGCALIAPFQTFLDGGFRRGN